MRWQVQEMARAERMLRDEQIAHEVETYNELIPDAGELSGTLFLELTSDDAAARVAPAARRHRVPHRVRASRRERRAAGKPSDEDEERLTRADTTAAVHYLRFAFTPEQVAAFDDGPGAASSSIIPSTRHEIDARRRRSTPRSPPISPISR